MSDAARKVMMVHGVTPLDDSAAADFNEVCAVFLVESADPAEPDDEDDDVPYDDTSDPKAEMDERLDREEDETIQRAIHGERDYRPPSLSPKAVPSLTWKSTRSTPTPTSSRPRRTSSSPSA